METGFVDTLVSQIRVVQEERLGAQDWDGVLAAFQESAAKLLAHPNINRLAPAMADLLGANRAGMPSSADDVKTFGIAPAGDLLYEMARCKGQWQVAELLARANQGYANMKGVAAIVRWAKMSTKPEVSIAKYLGRRLVDCGYWERTDEEGLLYWKHWRAGKNPGPVNVDEGPEVAAYAPGDQESEDADTDHIVRQAENITEFLLYPSEGGRAFGGGSLETVPEIENQSDAAVSPSLAEHSG